VLRTDLPDYRRSDDEELLNALARHDPLALAEAYHRTIPATHACARRLVTGPLAVEALVRAVYAALWDDTPPPDAPLEGWLRARCFALGVEHLRAAELAPASPSLATLLPDLPAPNVAYLDAAERALTELDDAERHALLLAHDCGIPSAAQEDDDAVGALDRALVALAGAEAGAAPDEAPPDDDACSDVTLLGDWALGLVPPDRAGEVAVQLATRPGCNARSRVLRRGRRRLEGLPPTPDMGQRVLVAVLAERLHVAAAPSAPADALDADAPAPTDTAHADEVALHQEVLPDGPGSPHVAPLDVVHTAAAGHADVEHADVEHLEDADDVDDPTEDLGDVQAAFVPAPPPPTEEAEGAHVALDDDDPRFDERRAGRRILRLVFNALVVLLGAGIGLLLGTLFVSAIR
jgi:DNA-directed RNA polymerase specialized sigma24 family protein